MKGGENWPDIFDKLETASFARKRKKLIPFPPTPTSGLTCGTLSEPIFKDVQYPRKMRTRKIDLLSGNLKRASFSSHGAQPVAPEVLPILLGFDRRAGSVENICEVAPKFPLSSLCGAAS